MSRVKPFRWHQMFKFCQDGPQNPTVQQQNTWMSVCADLLEQVEANLELMDQVLVLSNVHSNGI
jgi:hypothetical protein